MQSAEKRKPKSIFENDSFRNFTNTQFKDFLQNGAMMDDFLDQIESAIDKKKTSK